MSPPRRQMHLGVFVLGTGNHSAGWRYEGAATSNLDLAVIQEIARQAERGKFDLVFVSVPGRALMLRPAPSENGCHVVYALSGGLDVPCGALTDLEGVSQPGEGRAVEQHNTLGEVLAILPGLPGKCGRRDEYTLSCAPPSQSAEEHLDFRSHRLCRRRLLDQGA